MPPYKILVVDDEPDIVEFLEKTLRSDGYLVLPAYDGIAALDMASTDKPDLIILDIMMPMMSGYEVCEQLKSNPATQQIPVLCVSSAHSADARAKSMRSGAVNLVTKPFLPTELLAQVRRYLPQGEPKA